MDREAIAALAAGVLEHRVTGPLLDYIIEHTAWPLEGYAVLVSTAKCLYFAVKGQKRVSFLVYLDGTCVYCPDRVKFFDGRTIKEFEDYFAYTLYKRNNN